MVGKCFLELMFQLMISLSAQTKMKNLCCSISVLVFGQFAITICIWCLDNLSFIITGHLIISLSSFCFVLCES